MYPLCTDGDVVVYCYYFLSLSLELNISLISFYFKICAVVVSIRFDIQIPIFQNNSKQFYEKRVYWSVYLENKCKTISIKSRNEDTHNGNHLVSNSASHTSKKATDYVVDV